MQVTSVKLINYIKTTFVSVVTVHGLGGLSRTARVVDSTVSQDTGPSPGLVSSTRVGAGETPASPLTPDILSNHYFYYTGVISSTSSPSVQVSVHSLVRCWSQDPSEQAPPGPQALQVSQSARIMMSQL